MTSLQDIPLGSIDVSEFNTRKNLEDGQTDSTVEDLAQSIQRHGLLNPITVYPKSDGRYALIAGQRRYLACRSLAWATVPAIVRDSMKGADATAISLVENVHRADMNPNDKIIAFTALLAQLGDVASVRRETGVTEATIRKYVQMQALAPELRVQLAAGETRSTDALARLASSFPEPEKQLDVWERIGSFTQDVQQQIIRGLDPDLDNLDDLVDDAVEGRMGIRMVRNCPFDCPTIPAPLKQQVDQLIRAYRAKASL